jgi:hypothetical protein
VARVIEGLPSKCGTLGLILSTVKKKNTGDRIKEVYNMQGKIKYIQLGRGGAQG